jgi:hypothetical protein
MSAERPADEHAAPREHPGELLTAYLDDELPPAHTAEVDAHVAACGRCRADLDELAGARVALRTLPRLAAPPGFAASVVRSRRRATRYGVALALVAASVAVIAGLVAAPVADDGDPRPELSLTSDGSHVDAGLTTTASPSPGQSVPALQRPRPDAPTEGDGGPSLAERFRDRVGDAVSALLDTIGG